MDIHHGHSETKPERQVGKDVLYKIYRSVLEHCATSRIQSLGI
jgi:hypothetical protein